MASVSAMVGGGLFNAVAFAGAGYLFQKFNKSGYEEETKRHDLALEKLEKARQEWNQKDIVRQENMAALRRERSDADADFKNINKGIERLRESNHVSVRRKKIYAPTTPMGFLQSFGRDERIHDVVHRSDGIGWWMDRSENYI